MEEYKHMNDSAFTPMGFDFDGSAIDSSYFIDGITSWTSSVMDTDQFNGHQITQDFDGYLAESGVHDLHSQMLYGNLVVEPSIMVEDSSAYMESLKELPQSYVGFLSETGASELQNQMEWNYPVEASSFMPDYTSSYMEGHKLLTYQRQHDEAGEVETFIRLLNQKIAQKEKLNEDADNLRLQSSQVTPAPRRTFSEAWKQRARENEHLRKLKVSKNLKALQELIPYSMEAGQAHEIDHIINHIKYLQFQMKDLSRTNLGDESAPTHLSFLQDHTHYLLHDQIQHKPLEEMMGKLLEDDVSWVMQLLQSRGLFLMPISLAERFS